MFQIQRQDLEQNIAIYLKLKAEIETRRLKIVAQIESTLSDLQTQSRKQFEAALPELNYENRSQVRSVLPLPQIEVQAAETQRRLARSLTENLRGIVSIAYAESNQYRDSEFSPDGSVARRHLFSNLGSSDIDVTSITISVSVHLMQTQWLDQFFDDIGDVFRSIFDKDRHRVVMQERGEQTRFKAREQFTQTFETYIQGAKQEIGKMATSRVYILRKDLDQHIGNVGGVDGARKKIKAIEDAERSVAITSVFAELPLKTMKRLNWPGQVNR